MKNSTIRNLLLTCIFLDLALIGVVAYDYFQNDSDWIVIVLAVFAVFVVITAILFWMAGRGQGDRVIVQERVVEHAAEPQAGILPAIPPAPVRGSHFVAPVPPARPKGLPAVETGPFVYKGYTLHHRKVKLANAGGSRMIYFFSKKKPKSGSPCAKPAGYHVGVNERTGLPFLKKGAGKDGEDLTPEAEHSYRPQCAAVTADGQQCRNSARQGSKYCAPHFGYQPPTTKGLAQRIEGESWSDKDKQTDAATLKEADVKPKVKKAKDTKPSVRKSWFGRKK